MTGIEPNGSSLGIPTTVLRAYHNAERMLASGQRACHLQWWMLAAIGKVESDHAHRGQVDSRGTTLSPILGPRLDGTNGYAAIPDTDHGRWDGDTTWDRAVGPMQFIPSTWRLFGVDANGDRVADPNNIFDAAAAAGRYLCGSGRDLGDPAQLGTAYFSYDPSPIYVQNVLSWARAYASGTTVLPDNTTVLAAHDEPATASEAAPRPAGDSTPGRGPSVSGSPRPPATSPKPDIAQPQQPICAPPGGNPLPGAPSPRLAPQCLLDVTVLGIDPARLLPLPTTTPTTIP